LSRATFMAPLAITPLPAALSTLQSISFNSPTTALLIPSNCPSVHCGRLHLATSAVDLARLVASAVPISELFDAYHARLVRCERHHTIGLATDIAIITHVLLALQGLGRERLAQVAPPELANGQIRCDGGHVNHNVTP
ncbi:hypothetical protein BCR44DRAFT_206273, partial [Catenaria anguillulae PL171]